MPKLWQDEASHIEEMYEDDELIQQERSQQEEITSHQEEEVHEDPLELTEKAMMKLFLRSCREMQMKSTIWLNKLSLKRC